MDLISRIEKMREDMISSLKKFISINSVNPFFGGPGEKEMADWLMELLRNLGYETVNRYDLKDEKNVIRSNLVALIKGKDTSRTLWIVTHMDKVPEGDRDLWDHEPFDPVEKDGKIYGRGAEDNGGSLIASIFAGKALMDVDIIPSMNFGLALVADEEAGSKYGIEYLIEKGIFSDQDLFLVPDAGSPRGDFIEIAEKSILWMKVTVFGTQGHASVPTDRNAFREGAKIMLDIDKMLHDKYSDKDELFEPPVSTFEPTKVEKTVDNVNTIPGSFTFYIDSRVLPIYNLDNIVKDVERILRDKNLETKLEIVMKQSAPDPTPPDSEIVKRLSSALKEIRGIEPKVGGIGGGTCAAFFRKRGFHTAVWSTIDETAHQPNEYKKIEHMVEDAKIFAKIVI
ncbi:MAG TPA: M20 family metallo-hydrolase [Thermotoga sp.]|nr:M20 family metallo-hydrolase [Thermotoga sp.]